MSRYLTAQEGNHLSNNFVYINRLSLRNTLLEEQADPVDDFPRTHSVFHDTQRRRTRLFEIWGVASEPAQASVGVGDRGGNRLIHFVRQGGSQLSHGGHPVDVCEIRPRHPQRFFGALPL